MNRADFLRRLTTTAAGLLIAPDALELLAEPRRKVWPGWGGPKRYDFEVQWKPVWCEIGDYVYVSGNPVRVIKVDYDRCVITTEMLEVALGR